MWKDAIKKEIREDVEKAIADAETHNVDEDVITEGKKVLEKLDLKDQMAALAKEANNAETDEDKEALQEKMNAIVNQAAENTDDSEV